MTDEEINRRVAEIEGWALFDGIWAHADHCPRTYDHAPPYTTDWAWCGPLIEKHGIDLHWQPDDENGDKWMAYSFGINGMLAETPQIAICVAVMAANQNRQPATPGHWTGLGDK